MVEIERNRIFEFPLKNEIKAKFDLWVNSHRLFKTIKEGNKSKMNSLDEW